MLWNTSIALVFCTREYLAEVIPKRPATNKNPAHVLHKFPARGTIFVHLYDVHSSKQSQLWGL